ncbi:MAG: cytochrome c peroxidase [Methylococcales bacterium]|nr:cytochrome c peroxidase [Methylococcales bacterium]
MRFLIIIFILFVPRILLANNLLGLPSLIIPKDNLQTPEKIKLGQRLFNDKRLSADGSISCASCHHADKAFTDGLRTAKGIKGLTGTRNAPTVMNAAFYQSFFVDGRAKTLEEQALGPLTNPIEHGLKDSQAIINIVKADADYRRDFKVVFNTNEISTLHIGKAIASFERTLIGGNSKFDQYYFGRDRSQLSKSAARGLRIFRRKGNCANCHEISWNNARFTDNRFYNIGVGSKQLKPFFAMMKQGKIADSLTSLQSSELGRFSVTKIISDIGKFKTPTLRNIALTAPYMHDGSMKTLMEVIEYYDKGGNKNPFLDSAIFPLNFTVQEKQDLENFLQNLTSPIKVKVTKSN